MMSYAGPCNCDQALKAEDDLLRLTEVHYHCPLPTTVPQLEEELDAARSERDAERLVFKETCRRFEVVAAECLVLRRALKDAANAAYHEIVGCAGKQAAKAAQNAVRKVARAAVEDWDR